MQSYCRVEESWDLSEETGVVSTGTVSCGSSLLEHMPQLTHMGWLSLLHLLASWQSRLTVLGESSLVSGARGGPLESRNALEVFLRVPLHMLKSVRPAFQYGHEAAAVPLCPALLLLRLRR